MTQQTYYVGCSGWQYKDWRDSFYRGVPQRRWFTHYAAHFNTVEVNNTFYRWPHTELISKWYEQAPAGFFYTFKAHRKFTHFKKTERLQVSLHDFYQVCAQAHDKLGCILFQLPGNLTYDPIVLKHIVHTLGPEQRNVVEFRHPSWWCEEVYQVLAEHNIAFCTVSAPELPDVVKVTTDDLYIRFHGKEAWYIENYTDQELAQWAKAIQQSQAKRVWCYFNNTDNGYAVDNAMTLYNLLAGTSRN